MNTSRRPRPWRAAAGALVVLVAIAGALVTTPESSDARPAHHPRKSAAVRIVPTVVNHEEADFTSVQNPRDRARTWTVPEGRVWVLRSVSMTADSLSEAKVQSMRVVVGNAGSAPNLRTGTVYVTTENIGRYDPINPPILYGGQTLTVRWIDSGSMATLTARFNARVEFYEYDRGDWEAGRVG